MRILGIDVSWNGVRIPFTSYRIPMPVFVTGLISMFGSPAAANNRMESTGNSLMTNNTCPLQGGNQFGYQTQISCSYLSMQYFDRCFMESEGAFQSIDPNLKAVQRQVQLACKTNDGARRSNDALLLYNGRFSPVEWPHGSFSMTAILQIRDIKNCFIVSESSFQSIDPKLKNFQCQAILSCEPNFYKNYQGILKQKKDLLVLYRSLDRTIVNQPYIRPAIQPSFTKPVFGNGRNKPIVSKEDISATDQYLTQKLFLDPTKKTELVQYQDIVTYPPVLSFSVPTIPNGEDIMPTAKDKAKAIYPLQSSSSTTENQATVPSFPEIVRDRLRDSFGRRLRVQFEGGRTFSVFDHFLLNKADLKKALTFTIEFSLGQYEIHSDPVYSSAMECFRAKVDQFSNEFSEDSIIWKDNCDTAQQDKGCVQNLAPKERQQAEQLRKTWAELAVNYAGYAESFESNSLEITIIENVWSQLEEQQLASNKQLPCSSFFNKAVKGSTLYYFQKNPLSVKLEQAAKECHQHAKRNPNILPSFPEMVTYRLRESFSVRLSAQFKGYLFSSNELHIFKLQKALRNGVHTTIFYYRLQNDPVYSSANECFNSKMDEYSKEFSEDYMTWEAKYNLPSQEDNMCVWRLAPKEKEQAKQLRSKWIELAESYAKNFEFNAIAKIPEKFEKKWSELEAQQLESNEQQPCGGSLKKAVKGTTLYYFQSNTISVKLEQAAEDCHQKAKSNLKNEQKKFGMAS